MPTLEEIFSQLQTGKAVRIALPIKDRMEKERVSCVYQQDTPPEFTLLFTPGSLPVERIDVNRKTLVLLDISGKSISLAADIDKIRGEEALVLVGREVITHEQLRDYFRVDVSAPLVARPALPEVDQTGEDMWSLSGETIDVSGNGLLAIFSDPISQDKPVRIALVLPTGGAKTIEAVARVVRTKKISENQYHIALHFEQIESEDRDRIMACCFEIQRKHLQLKVRVKNPT